MLFGLWRGFGGLFGQCAVLRYKGLRPGLFR